MRLLKLPGTHGATLRGAHEFVRYRESCEKKIMGERDRRTKTETKWNKGATSNCRRFRKFHNGNCDVTVSLSLHIIEIF